MWRLLRIIVVLEGVAFASAAGWPPTLQCQKAADQYCAEHCLPTLPKLCSDGAMKATLDYRLSSGEANFYCVAPFSMYPTNDTYEAGTCFCQSTADLEKVYKKEGCDIPAPVPGPAPLPPRNASRFVDVFRAGEMDKQGTKYACFRIPAIVRTATGRLLAFVEGRGGKSDCSDHGDVRIVMKHSDDKGLTWSELSTVQVLKGHTIGNPAPIVDMTTGKVHLLFCRDNEEVYATSSEDNGRTWLPAVNHTHTLKPIQDHNAWVATGLPGGVQLHGKRLIIGADYTSPTSTSSFTIYSDDHGESWQRGAAPAHGDTTINNEASVAALPDGRLAMLMRSVPLQSDSGESHFSVALSSDGGETWETPSRLLPGLDGTECQGSALGTPYGLLVSGAFGGKTKRVNMSIWSLDRYGGRPGINPTYRLWAGPSAYSSLVDLSMDGKVEEFGLLFERGFDNPYEMLTFAAIGQSDDTVVVV